MLMKISGLARPLVSTSLVVLLAGCSTLGMDYAQPQITLSNAYAQKGSTGPAVTAETRWWSAFGDKTLDGLIDEGLAQNLTVAQALENIAAARATARINGVSYDPTVNGSASASASGNFDNASSVTHSRNAAIDASWEVDFFGTAKRNRDVQAANIDAAIEGANAARLTLIGDIARTYVNIRTYQRRLSLAKASLNTQQETTGVVQKRFEAGASTALAVAQSEGQSQTTAASIPSLEVALQQSINALAVLLGKEPAALKGKLGGSGSIPVVRKSIGAGVPADLLRNRPDVRQSERALAAAVSKIGIAEADLYPSLTLSGTLSTTGDVSSWSFLPTLSLPIFNRDKLTGSVDLAKSTAKSDYLAYRAAVLGSVQDVEDALVAYSKERTRRAALAAAVDSYSKAQELSQSLYKAGSADYSEVLTAQASLQSAQDALAQSDATLATAYITLAKALGGGWAAGTTSKAGK
jgi:multidrug efflux system outer membrane protein